MSNQSFPLNYEFGQDPVAQGHVTNPADLPWPFRQPRSRNCMDAVNHISLGHEPSEPVKECRRCGAVTLLKPLALKFATVKGWEARWARYCGCGGLWGVRSDIVVNE